MGRPRIHSEIQNRAEDLWGKDPAQQDWGPKETQVLGHTNSKERQAGEIEEAKGRSSNFTF